MISFNIHFLSKFLSKQNYSSVVVLTDTHTRRYCYPILQEIIGKYEPIEICIRPGEKHKNLETCREIWDKLGIKGVDRNALLINLGGGVVSDMGGFVAALYKRGIDCINVPTSLLAMVDASVGGKTGIDFNGFKNYLGVFQEPALVLIDPIFLKTLPLNHLYAGWAEMLKHGLVADKKYLLNLMQHSRLEEIHQQQWKKMIKKSITIKQAIVEKDPKDKGLRAILNFGHTIGHALETHYLLHEKQWLLHGEAVAIGMRQEAHISYHMGKLSKEELLMIDYCLDQYYQPLFEKTRKVLVSKKWQKYLVQDKKNIAGKAYFSLLKKIGKGDFHCLVDINKVP